MDLGLGGKTALVAAASKGIGKACAMGLAAEGVRVAICARTEADIEAAATEIRERTGGEVLAMAGDVTRPADVERFVSSTTQRFGGVDILVANAGGPARGYFDEASDEQWRQAFELSLMSVVRLIRAVLPSMRRNRWGRILAVQSSTVKQPLPGLLLSNALRPGAAGLLKSLSLELGPDNILLNTVCPGRIMTERFLAGHTQAGKSVDDYVATEARDIPLGRIGTPEEFANLVVFLASERASYITGTAIQVDGGMIRGLL